MGDGWAGWEKEEASMLRSSSAAEPRVAGIATNGAPRGCRALVLAALSLCPCEIIQKEARKPASFAL